MDWISIDPGFRRFGFTLWTDDRAESSHLREYRERGTKESFLDYRTEGVIDFSDFYVPLIQDVGLVVFETMPMNNITTQRALTSMVIGVILASNHMLGVETREISAIEVKSRVTNNPKASKPAVRRAVFDAFPHLRRERKLGDIWFDETDSTAVGMAWLSKSKDTLS